MSNGKKPVAPAAETADMRREKKIVAVKRENRELKKQLSQFIDTAQDGVRGTPPFSSFDERREPSDAADSPVLTQKLGEPLSLMGDRMDSPDELWSNELSEAQQQHEQPGVSTGGEHEAAQPYSADAAAYGGDMADNAPSDEQPELPPKAADIPADSGTPDETPPAQTAPGNAMDSLLSEALTLLPAYPELSDAAMLRELHGIAERSGLSLREICRAKLPRANTADGAASPEQRRRAFAASPPIAAQSPPDVVLSPLERQQLRQLQRMFPHMTPARFKAISLAEIDVD